MPPAPTDLPSEALPVGEDEFRMIADSAPVAVWVTRLDRRRSFVNRAYVEFLGVSYREALEFDWRAIIHPDDAAHLLAQSIAGEASMAVFELEGRYRRADGVWRWLHSTSQPRRDAAGRHIGFIGVAHDITEAKEAELSLRERESQLSAFINQATAGFGQVDLEGKFTLVNDRFCEIAGWSRAELMARTMQSITHPDDLGHNVELFERAVAVGTPYTHEKRYIRKDGGIVWVNNSVSVIRRPDGEPFGVLAVTIDVTQRRAGEAALRESETRYRTIFEQANDFIVTMSLDQVITSVNPSVLATLGYAEEEVIGRSIGDFMDPEQFALSRAALAQKLREGGTTRLTLQVRAKDGRALVWETNSRLTTDEAGRPASLHAIGRDMTEAKRAEAHQKLLIDELNHRVKNTLAIVQGIAQQTFKRDAEPVSARHAFEGRLAALSEAHSLLTREHWGPVSMARIIGDAVVPHGAAGSRFDLDGPDLPLAPKTAISLALAIHELATNAVKHGALSRPEGRVAIRWERSGTREAPRLTLTWTERGGPEVSTPSRRGFGTRMIEQGLAAELGGTVTIDFAAAGLICTVDAPLPDPAA
jgi:PAS domain S-box-containing protein